MSRIGSHAALTQAPLGDPDQFLLVNTQTWTCRVRRRRRCPCSEGIRPVSHSGRSLLHPPPSSAQGSPVSPHPLRHLSSLALSTMATPNRYEASARRGFGLRSPGGWRGRAPPCVPVGRPEVFSGEVSLQVFNPFFIQVVSVFCFRMIGVPPGSGN